MYTLIALACLNLQICQRSMVNKKKKKNYMGIHIFVDCVYNNVIIAIINVS